MSRIIVNFGILLIGALCLLPPGVARPGRPGKIIVEPVRADVEKIIVEPTAARPGMPGAARPAAGGKARQP